MVVNNLNDIKEASQTIGNKMLGDSLIVPNCNKVNTNRLVLVSAHFGQAPNPTNNVSKEPPLIFSDFENQIGENSGGYYVSDDNVNYEIVQKFVRNEFNYKLIVRHVDDNGDPIVDEDGNEFYDVINRTEAHRITEKYGYQYTNYIDDYDIGEVIPRQSVMVSNTAYDDYMNLCYGHNLRTVFMTYQNQLHEDSYAIAASAAKKMSFTDDNEITVNLNTNDIFLNLYGSKNHYKCFPDIGEYVKDQQLLMRRRINYDKILTDLKDLTKFREDDDVFYGEGKVIDIKVYCNGDPEVLRQYPYYEQILKYYDHDMEYHTNIVNYLKDLVENNTESCSDELIRFYNNSKKILDNNYWTYEANRFDNIIIKFTLLKEDKLCNTVKITGRYGRLIFIF